MKSGDRVRVIRVLGTPENGISEGMEGTAVCVLGPDYAPSAGVSVVFDEVNETIKRSVYYDSTDNSFMMLAEELEVIE